MVFAWLISLALVFMSVIVHYEALRLLAAHVEELKLPFRVRLRMALVMLAIIVTHFLEILLFAIGLYLAARVMGIGVLAGQVESSTFHEYLYFSLVSYTTLGLGDIYPTGGLQIITGVESLIGLLMITWSASFTFLYMEKFWRLGHGRAGETN